MKKFLFFLIICPFLLQAQDERNVSFSIIRFGEDAYGELHGKPDLLISPLSLSSAIAMIYAGAGGQTKAEIKKTMHYPEDAVLNNGFLGISKMLVPKLEATQFTMANKIWIDQSRITIDNAFVSTTKKYYNSEVEKLNFDETDLSRSAINKWAAVQTHDKIKEVIPDGFINNDLVMILSNAVYFKSNWAKKFDPSKTKNGLFTNHVNKKIEVSYMVNSGSFGQYEDDEMIIAELPYVGNEFSFIILFPKNSLTEMENHIKNELGLSMYTSGMSDGAFSIIQFPKFRASYHLEFNPVLESLGMNQAFTSNADFRKLGAASGPIMISKVLHDTFIEINEQGTEAAAVTTGGAVARSISTPISLIVDRPFMYAIRHKETNTILFLGKCSNPVY